MAFTIAEHHTPNQVLVVVSGETTSPGDARFHCQEQRRGLRRCAFLFDVSAATVSASGDEVRQLAMYAAR